MSEFKTDCHLCGSHIIRRPAEDGTWPPLNMDATPHEHRTVSVSNILCDIHYRDDEDKTKKIGDMTIQELEDRIKKLAASEAAMNLGSFLHATNGFVSKGFKQDFIKKAIIVDGIDYFVTGFLDDKIDDTIIEAKFVSSRRTLKKSRQYAIDQCDIYSWMTGLPKCKLVLHIIDEQKNENETRMTDAKRGEELVKNHIKNQAGI